VEDTKMNNLTDLLSPNACVQLDLTVRVGCELTYEAAAVTPVQVAFKPKQDVFQQIQQECIQFEPQLTTTEFQDDHGNAIYRLNLPPGTSRLRYDAIFMVPSLREDFAWIDGAIDPNLLPAKIIRYTAPSRYCDSDKLRNFAWHHFGHLPNGLERVLGICNWVHHHIEYRTGSGSPEISAHDVIQRGYGVCRDLAHAVVALCRSFNLPARYVSGYVSDIGVQDPGTPMDFHAYCEVYLGGRWQIFDARFSTPRTGRIRICAGYDAGDCAFTTLYGAAALTGFQVWSYQVDPSAVHVSDPIDLSQRLCGTPEIRLM